MKKIKLTQGKYALVDDEDYMRVNIFRWHLMSRGYAARDMGRKKILMHRFILGVVTNMYVDHINGDGLDNRKENLRFATQRQNLGNSRRRVDNKTGFKGVHYYKRDCSYKATIKAAGRNKHLGYFKTAEEAALAYNRAAIEIFGEFAQINKV